jgi:hypothetical protein
VKITLNIFTRGTVPVWNRFFCRIFTVTAVVFLLLSGTAQPKQFMAGYSEAIYRLMQSKDTGISIYKKYLKQQDAKILEATYDDIAGKFSFPPRMNRQGLRNAAELVSKDGIGDLNLSQFVDETVIDELEREGFFESLKKK